MARRPTVEEYRSVYHALSIRMVRWRIDASHLDLTPGVCLPVAWTGLPSGGKRPYFLCPWCRARCMELFLLDPSHAAFRCRRCAGLTYDTSQASRIQRLHIRHRTLRRRLGGGPDLGTPVPSKPRAMRWSTYCSICGAIEAVADATVAHMLPKLRRLSSSLSCRHR